MGSGIREAKKQMENRRLNNANFSLTKKVAPTQTACIMEFATLYIKYNSEVISLPRILGQEEMASANK